MDPPERYIFPSNIHTLLLPRSQIFALAIGESHLIRRTLSTEDNSGKSYFHEMTRELVIDRRGMEISLPFKDPSVPSSDIHLSARASVNKCEPLQSIFPFAIFLCPFLFLKTYSTHSGGVASACIIWHGQVNSGRGTCFLPRMDTNLWNDLKQLVTYSFQDCCASIVPLPSATPGLYHLSCPYVHWYVDSDCCEESGLE
jgi:hypothetical protein